MGELVDLGSKRPPGHVVVDRGGWISGPCHDEPEAARCRHCSKPIQRRPDEFWTHTHSNRERCMPGTRNAQMATA